jgi:dCTP deaminase
MCILPDHEILGRMKRGELVIHEYSDGSLTPNGYDLRIAEVRLQGGGR